MCNIVKNETVKKVKQVKRKPKCKFIPAGDTLAKCSELCADKLIVMKVYVKIYVITVMMKSIVLG